MAVKVYAKGNYFIIEGSDGTFKEDHKSKVRVSKRLISDTTYFINMRGNTEQYELADLTDESGNAYTQNSWETFAFANSGFSTASGGSGARLISGTVANYSSLPDATLNSEKFYYCISSQGTKWLPGSLGGTFYSSGLYYSNGTNWSTIDIPYNATQSEVNTGTNNDKFVTPQTLNGSTQLSSKVPYTGATSDLDLGSNNLNANAIHIKGTGGAGHLGLRTQSSDASASANEIALFADSSGNLKYKYDGTYYVTLSTSGNTANRTYIFQNASGTLAFTSDLSSYTPTTRSISTTAPLSGGGDLSSNRTLSIAQSTTSTDGYLSSTDWNTFNGKQTALVSGTNIKTFAGNSILGSGAITIPCEIQLACSDETTALTTGTGKVTFRMPYAMTVTEVRASLTTAQTSGSIFTVDINENGTSMISTKLTIDNTEKTSVTALTPAVISDSGLADDSEITIDIDQIGDGTAKGLKVTIKGTRTA